MNSRLQRYIQNSVKNLRWSALKSIVNGLLKLFCPDSMRDTWECLLYIKLIIVFTPNLEFVSYSEVMQYMEIQHSSEQKYNKD